MQVFKSFKISLNHTRKRQFTREIRKHHEHYQQVGQVLDNDVYSSFENELTQYVFNTNIVKVIMKIFTLPAMTLLDLLGLVR